MNITGGDTMDVTFETINEATVVVITGRIDSATSKDLETKLIPIINSGTRKLVVDFAKVDFISSAGLRILLIVAKKLKQANGKMALCCLKDTIKEVFDISGFSSIIPVFPTRDEALLL
jgi:anti-sigma B factor antagonist